MGPESPNNGRLGASLLENRRSCRDLHRDLPCADIKHVLGLRIYKECAQWRDPCSGIMQILYNIREENSCPRQLRYMSPPMNYRFER